MRTEKQKMISGEPYNAMDPQLVAERLQARKLTQQLNHLPVDSPEEERQAIKQALFNQETDVYVTPPFFCDYGYNIKLGSKVYFNFNCVVLDVAPVTIGNNVLFGPAVQVYTATHPLDAAERRSGIESARPIVIEDDVWIGGGAVICPGITIGARSVIGAGSVVTRDIPPDSLATGSPCRVIRKISGPAS
jgi:maltose O-acetyltransferase